MRYTKSSMVKRKLVNACKCFKSFSAHACMHCGFWRYKRANWVVMKTMKFVPPIVIYLGCWDFYLYRPNKPEKVKQYQNHILHLLDLGLGFKKIRQSCVSRDFIVILSFEIELESLGFFKARAFIVKLRITIKSLRNSF